MFKVNDLVVVKGQNEVMRVVDSDEYNTEVITGEPVDGHNIVVEATDPFKQEQGKVRPEYTSKKNFDTNDLDLVTHMGVIYHAGTHKPKVTASPSANYQDVSTDMSKLMIQVYNWMRDEDVDGEIYIELSCRGYTGDNELPITFEVNLGYNRDKIKGSDIWECARVIVDRYHTDKRMNPTYLPRFVDE
tara:strand:- start:1262 stop:1825 length:564 start_codon:yes stop_codon:yes gene_type:complete